MASPGYSSKNMNKVLEDAADNMLKALWDSAIDQSRSDRLQVMTALDNAAKAVAQSELFDGINNHQLQSHTSESLIKIIKTNFFVRFYGKDRKDGIKSMKKKLVFVARPSESRVESLYELIHRTIKADIESQNIEEGRSLYLDTINALIAKNPNAEKRQKISIYTNNVSRACLAVLEHYATVSSGTQESRHNVFQPSYYHSLNYNAMAKKSNMPGTLYTQYLDSLHREARKEANYAYRLNSNDVNAINNSPNGPRKEYKDSLSEALIAVEQAEATPAVRKAICAQLEEVIKDQMTYLAYKAAGDELKNKYGLSEARLGHALTMQYIDGVPPIDKIVSGAVSSINMATIATKVYDAIEAAIRSSAEQRKADHSFRGTMQKIFIAIVSTLSATKGHEIERRYAEEAASEAVSRALLNIDYNAPFLAQDVQQPGQEARGISTLMIDTNTESTTAEHGRTQAR